MDVLGKLTLVLLTVVLSSGCQLGYLIKSAYNQMDILYNREDIGKVMQNNQLPTEVRAKLTVTQKVRAFASAKLGLNVGKNYSTYVQLDRPYVVWAVNASPKWKLEHFLWHFPIVGAVPYKGFRSEADAKSEADDLQVQGYDTFIRGVSAYSTLGWFNDPLLSSMMNYSEEDLVNTVIHESVHATLYIKSNADFNERLASFVGDKGTELFYLDEEGPYSNHLQKIRDTNDDDALFSSFISTEIKNLKIYYINEKSQDLQARELQFEGIKRRFQESIKPKLKSKSRINFDRFQLNNARLLLFKTYVEDISDFQKVLDSVHGDIIKFLAKIKTLESSSNPVEGIKNLY